jgi:hypothetical protein
VRCNYHSKSSLISGNLKSLHIVTATKNSFIICDHNQMFYKRWITPMKGLMAMNSQYIILTLGEMRDACFLSKPDLHAFEGSVIDNGYPPPLHQYIHF